LTTTAFLQAALALQIDTIFAELDKELHRPDNVEQAQLLLRLAQKYVRELNKRASNLRVTHSEDQIRSLKDIDNEKAAKIREHIIKAEAFKKMYKKLRSYLKPERT
jgi:hypothetical protein